MDRDDAIGRVRGWLREAGTPYLETPGAAPTLSFKHGSTLVLASAFGGDDSPVFLRLSARIVRDVSATGQPDLLAYLLRRNESLVFSAFSVDEAGDIYLSAVLFADGLAKSEFAVVLAEFTATADQADDDIVRRWGGARFQG
jgi:hypothetical protein